MPSSIFTNPMKRGMLISPPGWWELLSRTYVEPPGGTSTSPSKVFQTDGEVPLANGEPVDAHRAHRVCGCLSTHADGGSWCHASFMGGQLARDRRRPISEFRSMPSVASERALILSML